MNESKRYKGNTKEKGKVADVDVVAAVRRGLDDDMRGT